MRKNGTRCWQERSTEKPRHPIEQWARCREERFVAADYGLTERPLVPQRATCNQVTSPSDEVEPGKRHPVPRERAQRSFIPMRRQVRMASLRFQEREHAGDRAFRGNRG